MMGLFGQKKHRQPRYGHTKADNQHPSGQHAQVAHGLVRPVTAVPMHAPTTVYEARRPTKPPRPAKTELPQAFVTRPQLDWSNGSSQIEFEKLQHGGDDGVQLDAQNPYTSFDEEIAGYNRRRYLRDVVADQFSEVITLIDEDSYHGPDRDFIIKIPSPTSSEEDVASTPVTTARALIFTAPTKAQTQLQRKSRPKQTIYQQPVSVNRSINFFSKVSYYENSRLPLSLPALRVYIPTWPLFCLAAQYSNSVYQDPSPATRLDTSTFVPSDSMLGTKAMVISSHPCDSQKTIVFAIRGTSVLSLKDWNTNLHATPTPPTNFLDDDGNLCHAGFLRVARAMVRPIAMRLRQLLAQNPSRATCSLLITGHSAGGAVASLLYAHMLSQTVESDLTILASCFKRVHCITFGTPPISLLPLTKPEQVLPTSRNKHNMEKCLFYSFINEGDPVVRAEKSYVKSLIDLVTTQIPPTKDNLKTISGGIVTSLPNISKLDLSLGAQIEQGKKKLKKITSRPLLPTPLPQPQPTHNVSQPQTWPSSNQKNHRPTWALPPSTLSNAGRLVVLHFPSVSHHKPLANTTNDKINVTSLKYEFENVQASIITDDQLRTIVFGDPLMHAMEIYRRRVEALAMRAVTGN